MAVKKREGMRKRLARRMIDAAGGGVVAELMARIDRLEDELQENRNLNLRVAELVDVVQELLLPVASQDRARIDEALDRFQRSL